MRGRVELSPLTMNRATTTSSNEAMKANSAPEKIDNFNCGSVTLRNAHARDAPRLRAAISWFMSNPCRPLPTAISTKGMARTLWARIKPVMLLFSPVRE
ncbi:hypothetical protein D3C79_760520 [compost metagenome]